MNALPDALFVIDVGYHKIAVREAEEAGHSGRRGGRHQPLAGRRRLRDSGQRRLEPRDPAVRRGVADAVLEGKAAAVQGVVQAVTGGDEEFVEVERRREEVRAHAEPFIRNEGAVKPLFVQTIARTAANCRSSEWRKSPQHGQGTAREDRRADDGMQEGAAEADGDLPRPRRSCASSWAARRARGVARRGRRRGRGSHLTARGRARRGQLRDRLRREERRLPGLRRRRSPAGREARVRPTSRRCRPAARRRDGRRRRARHSSARSARTWRAPLRAHRRRRASSPPTCTAARIGVLVEVRAATRDWRRTWRCTSRRASRSLDASGVSCRADRAPSAGIAIEKAREAGKPARRSREDGRGQRAEVPEGGHAARPGVREEDDKQTVEQLLKARRRDGERVHAVRGWRGHREEADDFAAEVARSGGCGRAPDGSARRWHSSSWQTWPTDGILLKLRGEALMGDDAYGINRATVESHGRARSPKSCSSASRWAVVIGGGNIFRGVASARRAWTAPRPTTWACWRR